MRLFLALTACAALGCGDDAKTDAQYKAEVIAGMHDTIATQIVELENAAVALQTASPTPAGRGWDATQDAAALVSMRAAWKSTRVAYEHFEGAVAPIFPDIDFDIDARYDDYLVTLGGNGDSDPFDGNGLTGMHAIERILYADRIPQRVVEFESTLPGYAAARFPGTAAEAQGFKTKLVQRLIDDVTTLRAQWQPAAIDVGAAFQGLVALMNEQQEKVNKASTGEEESRYAQLTLFDLRNNLEGTTTVYELFRPWILSKPNGAATNTSVETGLAGLATLYDSYTGDAIPAPPDDWSSDAPTPANLATPFGKLYSAVRAAVDPNAAGSVVTKMNGVATVLGFPEFVEE